MDPFGDASSNLDFARSGGQDPASKAGLAAVARQATTRNQAPRRDTLQNFGRYASPEFVERPSERRSRKSNEARDDRARRNSAAAADRFGASADATSDDEPARAPRSAAVKPKLVAPDRGSGGSAAAAAPRYAVGSSRQNGICLDDGLDDDEEELAAAAAYAARSQDADYAARTSQDLALFLVNHPKKRAAAVLPPEDRPTKRAARGASSASSRCEQVVLKDVPLYAGATFYGKATVVFRDNQVAFEYKTKTTGHKTTTGIDYGNIEAFANFPGAQPNGAIDLAGEDEEEPTMPFFAVRPQSKQGICVWAKDIDCGGPSDDPKAYIVVDLSGRYDEYARTVLSTFVFGEDVELSSRRSQLATLYTLINEPASFLKGVAVAGVNQCPTKKGKSFLGTITSMFTPVTRAKTAAATAANRRKQPPRAAAATRAVVNVCDDDDDDLRPVFTYPHVGAPDAIVLTNADRARCEHGEFLNDNLINMYLKHAQTSKAPARSKVHVFSTFFFTKLLEVEDEFYASDEARRAACYAKVRRWAKGVDLFGKELLFVPVNEHLHWSLAVVANPGAAALAFAPSADRKPSPVPSSTACTTRVIDLADSDEDECDLLSFSTALSAKAVQRRKASLVYEDEEDEHLSLGEGESASQPCILQMDSLRSHDAGRVARYLRDFLKAAWADREDAPPLDGRFEPETLRLVRPKLPKQHNSFDCGVYVLKFFDDLFDHRDPLALAPEMLRDEDTSLGGRFHYKIFTANDVKDKRKELATFFDDKAATNAIAQAARRAATRDLPIAPDPANANALAPDADAKPPARDRTEPRDADAANDAARKRPRRPLAVSPSGTFSGRSKSKAPTPAPPPPPPPSPPSPPPSPSREPLASAREPIHCSPLQRTDGDSDAETASLDEANFVCKKPPPPPPPPPPRKNRAVIDLSAS